jgi:hypothetical protein
MQGMNKLVAADKAAKTITVQAGELFMLHLIG